MDRVSLFPVEYNRAWFSIGGAEELHGGKGGVGKLCDSLWKNLEFVTVYYTFKLKYPKRVYGRIMWGKKCKDLVVDKNDTIEVWGLRGRGL